MNDETGSLSSIQVIRLVFLSITLHPFDLRQLKLFFHQYTYEEELLNWLVLVNLYKPDPLNQTLIHGMDKRIHPSNYRPYLPLAEVLRLESILNVYKFQPQPVDPT